MDAEEKASMDAILAPDPKPGAAPAHVNHGNGPSTHLHVAADHARQIDADRAGRDQAIAAYNAQQQYAAQIQAMTEHTRQQQYQQQQAQYAPADGDPGYIADPDTYARQTRDALLNLYSGLASYGQQVDQFNHGQLNDQCNESEYRARQQHGDAVVDAATRMAVERGVNTQYAAKVDSYAALIRDWTEIQAMNMPSDQEFFREMVNAKLPPRNRAGQFSKREWWR